ncbi:hypothetical protein MPC4_70071 [Methylocella tundrae]|uniref:Uncharacterized protein n=1 Tax=Methylocella tundrae TaxID=227605 RepID=A0A8B6MB11_METTU|nr:hypothetical protein [Methylocella tundrae]VTZ52183.1 hypothetical protein MPC4_70071 [Methylocella tundrae]
MHRVITYAGAVPSSKDVLNLGQFTMTALAKFVAGVLGTNTIVNGFTCSPTTVASLAVVLGAGEIYQLENLEQTALSALPADTAHTIMKQGILLDPVTLTITPPATTGYSQAFLVEVQYQDSDTSTMVLNYYNSTAPSSPYYGPPVGGTGSGAAQSTVRAGAVAYQIKAGIAASTGTQVTPTADAGWTGLFVVTVANGATAISSGNISPISNAPFIPATLPAIPYDVQSNAWTFAIAGGTANALTASISPAPASLSNLSVRILATATNTGNVTLNLNGISGAVPILDGYGNQLAPGAIKIGMVLDLDFNGTNWQLTGPGLQSFGTYYGVDTGLANAIVATVSPAITSYIAGALYEITIANPNTTASTANFNGLGAKNIVLNTSGATLSGGEMSNVGGYAAQFLYDGTNLRLLNPLPKGVSRIVPFTASGTFTPVGSLVLVQQWAGGAAGRNVGGSSYTAGQGGGAGEYRYGYFPVTPGVGIAVTVGAGAAAGSNGNGGMSSFGSLMTAIGAIGTAGGTGGAGGYGFSGGAGSPGFSNGNVAGAIVVIGSGGVPYLSGLFGSGGAGGDGGPTGNPYGRAGQPGFVLVSEVG